jgi:hypothetical protein
VESGRGVTYLWERARSATTQATAMRMRGLYCLVFWGLFLAPDGVVGGFFGIFEPSRHGRLLAGIELDRFAALDVEVAEEGLVPAGEGEPGHGGGDADVDADHAGVEILFELAGGVAALGEDGGAVAVGAIAAYLQGGFEAVGADDGEDGAEDFFGGDTHGGFDAIDHAGAKEEAVGGGVLAAIQSDRGAFFGADVEIAGDTVAMSGGDERAHVYFGLSVGCADFHFGSFVDEAGNEFITDGADGEGDGTGHAALTGAAIGAGGERGDGLVEIGIGHDDQMILSAAGGLDALAVAGAGFVNVFGDCSRTNERDRLDCGMGE